MASKQTRPKGSGSVREVRPGVWQLRVNLAADALTGAQRQKAVNFRGNKTDAQKELAKLVAKTAGERTTGTGTTFGRLLNEWLERKAHGCSPTTMHEYRRIVDTVWVPALGDIPLDRLKAKHLQAVVDAKAKAGLSAPSIIRQFACARGALRLGVRLEWLDRSPHENVVLPGDGRDRPDDPSLEELLAILRAANELDPGLGLVLRVAAAVGCRRGELCGLRWRDVNWEAGTATIRRTVVLVPRRSTADAGKPRRSRRVLVKDTKTHAKRTLTTDPDTVALLKVFRARAEAIAAANNTKLGREAYIFSRSVDGADPLRPDWISTAFKRSADDAGVTAHLHQLRHLNVSALLGAGIPLAVASKRAGHAKQSTTTDFYNDVVVHGVDDGAARVIGTMLAGIGTDRLAELEPAQTVTPPG